MSVPKFHYPNLSVTSGELSPLLASRADLSAYDTGARELTNFLVLPQGGFINRPGTKLISGGMADCRLIPFVVNVETAYVVVLYPGGRIRIFDQDGFVSDVWNSAGPSGGVFANHPYLIGELKTVRYLQSIDILFMFHHNHQPLQLERHGINDWRLNLFDIQLGPYSDFNINPDLQMRLIDLPVGGWTLQSNFDVFTSNMVGSLILMEFFVPPRFQVFDFTPAAMANPIPMHGWFGTISIQTQGPWTGTIRLYRRGPDDLDFVLVSTMTSEGVVGGVYSAWRYQATEWEAGVVYQFVIDSDETITMHFNMSGGIGEIQMRITEFVDSQTVRVEPANPDIVLRYIAWTHNWAFGSFGTVWSPGVGVMFAGWPAVAVFHQERLILANTLREPTTVWMSQAGRWNVFEANVPALDDDAIRITLASRQANAITAMSSREDLLIFTAGAEFVAHAGSRNDIFTPSTVIIVPSDYRGSQFTDTLDIGHLTLFVQRHGNAIRSLGYQLETDGYSTNELSILSQHLFDDVNVTFWAYQQHPWSVIWIALSNGHVLALTFNKEHQVIAWTRQVFNGFVHDLCTIPGEGQDDLFMLMDDRLVLLQHREDRTGRWESITYTDEGTPYVSSYESLELEEMRNAGTLQGRHKQVPRITMRVHNTCGFEAGVRTDNNNELDQIRFPGDGAPQIRNDPYTGDVFLEVPGGFGKMSRLRIRNGAPVPVTILGIYKEVVIHDDA